MTEIWKDIIGYEGLYQVSNLGRVKSLSRYDRLGRYHTGKILSDCDNGTGYRIVGLKVDGKQKTFTIHRLVATAFIENLHNYDYVNHKDGDKTNNRVDNLEWCTASENMLHAVKLGLHYHFGKRKILCVETGQIFNSIKDAESWVGVKGCRISSVCNLKRGCKTCGGYHWRYVE
jgi:hypothetical protein